MNVVLQILEPWYQMGADIATMLSIVSIAFLFVTYYKTRDARNLQLMNRCIDNFRKWSVDGTSQINFFYLELLNEELFYFQNKMIDKKVAIEWIEGMIDCFQVYAKDGTTILNDYSDQQSVKSVLISLNKQGVFCRIEYFVKSGVDKSHKIPLFSDPLHEFKKRKLALELFKYIKKYKF